MLNFIKVSPTMAGRRRKKLLFRPSGTFSKLIFAEIYLGLTIFTLLVFYDDSKLTNIRGLGY